MRQKRGLDMSDTKIEFLYLNEEDMIKSGVLDAGRCVDVMEDVVTLLSEGDYRMGGKENNSHGLYVTFPDESNIKDFPLNDSRDRRFVSMPAYLGGKYHLCGEKWYGSNGRNAAKGLPRSILMVTLNDLETGQPIAYMSANLLSAMRTGAMPGVVAKHLARKDSKVIALIGAGVVNKTSIMAYLSKFPGIEKVKIKGSTPTSRTAMELKAFIEEKYPDLKEVTVCKTLEEAVKDADIISEGVSTTARKWPVYDPKWFKPGVVFISSGSMGLTDLTFARDHMTKVVDNIKMYEEYVDEFEEYDKQTGKRLSSGIPGMYFVNMIQDGEIDSKEVRHLGDIVRGIVPGRTSDDEMFLVSVGGMPILDVAWGKTCYDRAVELGYGTNLKLWDQPYFA